MTPSTVMWISYDKCKELLNLVVFISSLIQSMCQYKGKSRARSFSTWTFVPNKQLIAKYLQILFAIVTCSQNESLELGESLVPKYSMTVSPLQIFHDDIWSMTLLRSRRSSSPVITSTVIAVWVVWKPRALSFDTVLVAVSQMMKSNTKQWANLFYQ